MALFPPPVLLHRNAALHYSENMPKRKSYLPEMQASPVSPLQLPVRITCILHSLVPHVLCTDNSTPQMHTESTFVDDVQVKTYHLRQGDLVRFELCWGWFDAIRLSARSLRL
eukprot:gene6688-biopygen16446